MHYKLSTKNIDRAAFFTTLGIKLDSIGGKYPENIFNATILPWVVFYEKYIGLINYRKFCEERRKLKVIGRKMAGLPERFTGKDNGTYKGRDIIVFKGFSSKEKDHFKEHIFSS